ncbi:MAG: Tim44 domain-containing protein [Rhodospirillaceae bacterium]|nr:Tim44 domain-containing protein [Rhodospirillaceae bacterium]MBL6930380.1 Tim44 domain-containing protein [Rhodospirillales bacterium]
MNDGFQFFDIILFAMIAVFLILRLRSVLGRRDGHEGNFSDFINRLSQNNKDKEGTAGNDNIFHLDKQDDEDFKPAAATIEEEEQSPLLAGLRAIAAADSDFDPDEFISGARIAFEYILGAYASGDSKALKPLLSSEVFANFEKSIRDREEAKQTMEETLVGIRKADLVEAEMEGAIAQITVKFVSDQVHALSDEEGTVVEGDPNKIVSVTDFWTFAHDTRSRDPNWSLTATRSLD